MELLVCDDDALSELVPLGVVPYEMEGELLPVMLEVSLAELVGVRVCVAELVGV